jgi:hypothetical protein
MTPENTYTEDEDLYKEAKEIGICKEVQKIKDIKAGDVFDTRFGGRIMLIQPIYGFGEFNIAGLNGLLPYRDFNALLSREDMIEFLNEGGFKFIANINDQINDLIKNAQALSGKTPPPPSP